MPRAKTERRKTEPAHKGGHTVRRAAQSKMTTDHEKIRRWVESRGGRPAKVKGTGRAGGDVGMLRIDFPGYTGAGKLERIDWDEFFEKFEESQLALVYQDKTATGRQSRFNKLVSRDRL